MPGAKVCLEIISKYPKAAFILWKQINVFKCQVIFSMDKEDHLALFSCEGTWLETITPVPLDFTPKPVQQNFEGNYNREGLRQNYHVQMPLRSIFEMQWSNGIYTLKLVFDNTGKMVGKLIS